MRSDTFPKIFVFITVLAAMAVGQTVSNEAARAAGEVTLLQCWSSPVEDGRALTVSGENIFVARGGARVESISIDGQKLWSTELGGEIASNLIVGDGGVYLATSVVKGEAGKNDGGTLRLLSKETGITGWTAKLPEADTYSLGFGSDSVIVVTSKGTIEAFYAKTGTPKWRRELAEGFVGEPQFNHSFVYIASTANQVFTLSLASGEIVAMKKLKFAPTAVAEISGEVFTGDERGNLTSLGRRDNANWNFKSGGKISAIVETGHGSLLVASNDNFVYLLSGRNGVVTWKKRLNERISQIGVIDDKFALVSGFEEHAAYLIDLESGKTVGQLSLAEDEFAVARPVFAGGRFFVLTNNAVHSHSAGNSCQ